jgi:hypothetical protein
MEIREEEKQIEKIKKAHGEEQDAIFNPALWGGNVNGKSENSDKPPMLIFSLPPIETVITEIVQDPEARPTTSLPKPENPNNTLSNNYITTKVDKEKRSKNSDDPVSSSDGLCR